ncbi:MAG TPA: crotonase/enoyl-CoA hydratase family protein [Vicinamibacterales bacterium]|nr:crotonase/enoyl-CoA hydratase family protein [Vicinamibacterales bacterium]
MTELVTLTVTDHVADVRFNRPEKMNALNIPMFEAISAAAEEVMRDRSIRAVVLSGEGRAFCAGLDLSNFTDPNAFGNNGAGPFVPGRGGFWPNFYQKPGYLWKDVPVPVIAALHGAVFGGGFQIALGADIRIAHPDVKMSLMEIKWGLIPDMSGSQTLRDLVRIDIAKELAFTGRIVEGAEAEKIGLVTRLDESPREAALALAREIASKNPQAIALDKLLFETTWHGDDARGLELEEKLQANIIMSPNQVEAVMAGMQKRPASYADRTIERLDRANPLGTLK